MKILLNYGLFLQISSGKLYGILYTAYRQTEDFIWRCLVCLQADKTIKISLCPQERHKVAPKKFYLKKGIYKIPEISHK